MSEPRGRCLTPEDVWHTSWFLGVEGAIYKMALNPSVLRTLVPVVNTARWKVWVMDEIKDDVTVDDVILYVVVAPEAKRVYRI